MLWSNRALSIGPGGMSCVTYGTYRRRGVHRHSALDMQTPTPLTLLCEWFGPGKPRLKRCTTFLPRPFVPLRRNQIFEPITFLPRPFLSLRRNQIFPTNHRAVRVDAVLGRRGRRRSLPPVQHGHAVRPDGSRKDQRRLRVSLVSRRPRVRPLSARGLGL